MLLFAGVEMVPADVAASVEVVAADGEGLKKELILPTARARLNARIVDLRARILGRPSEFSEGAGEVWPASEGGGDAVAMVVDYEEDVVKS